jgi:hypothetical protein
MKEENQREYIKDFVTTLKKIDKEIKLVEEELLSLPTKEERIKRVKKITQSILTNEE